MAWPQVAVSLLIFAALVAAWNKYSITSKPLARVLELYLWITPILSFSVLLVVHDRTGLRGLVPAAVIHLVVIAWALRSVYRGGPGHFAARVAGWLLIFGGAVVWLGALTFAGMDLPGIAAQPENHLFTVGGFLIGGLLSLTGFAVLRTVLRERGDSVLSQLGLIALLIATICWIIHLAFRATVMVAVAEKFAEAPPEWYPPLRLWSGAMYVSYMVLASLSLAAYGLAMAKTGWAGKGWGWGFVAFAVLVPVGNVPLAAQFVPYAMGMILLRRASVAPHPVRQERGKAHESGAANSSPLPPSSA